MALPNRRSILVLYGTETGNSMEIAQHVGRMCQRLRFPTLIEEMDDVKLSDLVQNHALVICVLSTTGQGDFPTNALRFWKSLRRAKLRPDCLAAVDFTAFGLGDGAYDKFNWAARLLKSRLEKLGAREVFPCGESDERQENGIDSFYPPWQKDLKAYLLAKFPLPDSVQPIPDEEPLPAKYIIRLRSPMDVVAGDGAPDAAFTRQEDERWEADKEKNAALSHVDHPRSNAAQFDEDWERMKLPDGLESPRRLQSRFSRGGSYLAVNIAGQRNDNSNILKDAPSKYLLNPPSAPEAGPPPEGCLPDPACRTAKVTWNKRVTPESHWQDVRLLEIEVDIPDEGKPVHPLPGHTLVVYPKSFPADVRWLIDRMGWTELADTPVEFDLLRPDAPSTRLGVGVVPKGLHPLRNATLRDLLIHNLDITAIPTRTFLEKISHYAVDAREKEKLVDLTKLDNTQEFYDFTSRPRRTILEVLGEFESVKIPIDVVIDLFPLIRGREFSIASGGRLLKGHGRGSLPVQILAALVEYKTVIRKPRQGLCSRYLKHLENGTRIHVAFRTQHAAPCQDPDKPMIAIATGTGIAPIRSLLHDRDDFERPGPALLFFGCRNREADFHFADEFASLWHLRVIPAFSRDAPQPDHRTGDPGRPTPPVTMSGAEGGTAMGPWDALSTGMLAYAEDRGKNYVQHHIRQHGAQVCEFIRRGARIYLCGNSGAMPKAVYRALVDVMMAGNLCTSVAQADMLLAMRFWVETW